MTIIKIKSNGTGIVLVQFYNNYKDRYNNIKTHNIFDACNCEND